MFQCVMCHVNQIKQERERENDKDREEEKLPNLNCASFKFPSFVCFFLQIEEEQR